MNGVADPAISIVHVLNPFPAAPGSEHARASRVTWQTLRRAHQVAAGQGLAIEVVAVVLPGDEAAVEAPAQRTLYLTRTVQDLRTLRPRRPLPLIADILGLAAAHSSATHVIFSNMDIALQPDFYTRVHAALSTSQPAAACTVARVNIDATLTDIEQMYAADGVQGQGYDCFVMPREAIGQLDLGLCCLGAAHFDYLLYMQLDVLCPGGVRSLAPARLTFHLGNDIAWAAQIDYIEHNLAESMLAIQRFMARHDVSRSATFQRLHDRHFKRNAAFTSRLLRQARRLPLLSGWILHIKRLIGRQY